MLDRLSTDESVLVDALEGARLLQVSERKFHELRHTSEFPAAVVLGPRCVRWLRFELAEYARSLPRVAVLPELSHLRRNRG